VVLSCAIAVLCFTLSACEKKLPRSYNFFMEDRIAREGTLVRCDKNPIEAQADIECANAHRAAVEIALRFERERAVVLERESERSMAAIRAQLAESQRIAREERERAAELAREAYEELWRRANEAGLEETMDPPGEERGDALSLIELPGRSAGEETAAE
jgi:hypothetical protein